jgi:NAD-dependent DNA ligase
MDANKARVLTNDFLAGVYTIESLTLLRAVIKFHDYQYRVLSMPIIDDSKYDTLFDLLLSREAISKESIPADSPSQLV